MCALESGWKREETEQEETAGRNAVGTVNKGARRVARERERDRERER